MPHLPGNRLRTWATATACPAARAANFRRVEQSTCGGGHESGPVRITHAHLAADPGPTPVDRPPRVAGAGLALGPRYTAGPADNRGQKVSQIPRYCARLRHAAANAPQ